TREYSSRNRRRAANFFQESAQPSIRHDSSAFVLSIFRMFSARSRPLPNLLLYQIDRPSFYFFENHSNVDAQNSLEDHRDRARDGENQNERSPAGNELFAVSTKPDVAGIGQFK